jgi:DNA replication protein DnaC
MEQERIEEEKALAVSKYAERTKAEAAKIPYRDHDLAMANHSLLRDFGEAAFSKGKLAHKGVYAWGGAGSWKTRSAAFCANLAAERGYSLSWRSVPAMLIGYSRLTMESQDAVERFISDMTRPDVLILDDLGKGSLTNRGVELLYTILDARFVENKPIWYTANAPPCFVKKWIRTDDVGYGESIQRRIEEGTEVIKA